MRSFDQNSNRRPTEYKSGATTTALRPRVNANSKRQIRWEIINVLPQFRCRRSLLLLSSIFIELLYVCRYTAQNNANKAISSAKVLESLRTKVPFPSLIYPIFLSHLFQLLTTMKNVSSNVISKFSSPILEVFLNTVYLKNTYSDGKCIEHR